MDQLLFRVLCLWLLMTRPFRSPASVNAARWRTCSPCPCGRFEVMLAKIAPYVFVAPLRLQAYGADAAQPSPNRRPPASNMTRPEREAMSARGWLRLARFRSAFQAPRD